MHPALATLIVGFVPTMLLLLGETIGAVSFSFEQTATIGTAFFSAGAVWMRLSALEKRMSRFEETCSAHGCGAAMAATFHSNHAARGESK